MKRLLTIFLFWIAGLAGGHEVRPAYLELTERAPGEFDALWKVPAPGGVPLAGEELPHETTARLPSSGPTGVLPCGCPAPTAEQLARGVLPIHPSLPKGAEMITPPLLEKIYGADIKRWKVRAPPEGLEDGEITVHGLSSSMVDVLVKVQLADGRSVTHLLRPESPSFVFHAAAGPASGEYFGLGIGHILLGIDHLLFVLALVLIVKGTKALVKTITAFTVAHSVTLGMATLGVVKVPSAPVEAVIALSIVFVALEIVRSRRGERGLTERSPWLVAGSFGLLHGFGFAGALSEVGLTATDIPLALLFFNIGVEFGQLVFVFATLCIIQRLRRFRLPRWAPFIPPYAIGAVAMFWVIERTAAIW